MSDEDMIRRGDAFAALKSAGLPFGYGHAAEVIRNIPAVQVAVKPLDLSYVQKHAFLAGVVAARNVPPNQPCSGPLLWLDYDPGDNPALSRIQAALAVKPSPEVGQTSEVVPQQLMVHCVNAHDRCDGGPCPYCEPCIPLRYEDGSLVGAEFTDQTEKGEVR